MFSVLYIALVIFITLTFVAVSAVVLVSTHTKLVMNAEYQADALCGELDKELNSYLDICQNISTNTLITDILCGRKDYNTQTAVNDNVFLKKYFSSFAEIENYIPNQFLIYTFNEGLSENAYIRKISELERLPVWPTLENVNNYDFVWEYSYSGNAPYLSLFKKIYVPGVQIGYFEVKIPVEKLTRGFDGRIADDYTTIELINKNGDPVYKKGVGTQGRQFKKTAINGDVVVLTLDTVGAMKGNLYMILLFFILYVLLIIGTKVISDIIVSKITGELNGFIHTIRKDNGMLLNSQLIDVSGDDEIREIKERFKELIENNNRLHENIEKANRERQQAELNFLQYSINPHLLYNSLSCVKWCVLEKSEDEVGDLIDSMTEYYRMALSGGENFIPVKEEIYLTKRYVSIMEIIYDTKIELEFNIDESLLEQKMIKMLLQPIVENSVLHGLVGIDNAKITITVSKTDGGIVFSVKDNGYGMNDEQIKNMMKDNVSEKKKNYGLKNVIKRIKCYYGENCRLEIQSTPGMGTEVQIIIVPENNIN